MQSTFASRTLTTAEQRYAQIENKMLAGVWECEKLRRHLVGLKEFNLLTDHRPLVPLMNTKCIDDAQLLCQQLLVRAMRFNPIIEYVPGKQLVIADALPRKSLVGRESRIDDIDLSDDIAALVEAVQQNWPVTEDRITEIRVETSKDTVMKSITYFIANVWPCHESTVPHSARDYYRERALRSLIDGVVNINTKL